MVGGHCADENDESRIGGKGRRTPISQQCLPLPQHHLLPEAVLLQEGGGREVGGKKLTRARKEDEEVGLSLNPYYTSNLSGSTVHPLHHQQIGAKGGPTLYKQIALGVRTQGASRGASSES